MRLVTFVSLAVFVYAAPLNEQNVESEIQQDENKVILVKRAKEFMMYGNQQNEQTNKEKRSEPSEIESTVDQHGEVVAEQPVDIEQPEEVIADTPGTPEQEAAPDNELPTDTNMHENDPVTSEEELGSEEGEEQAGVDSEVVENEQDEVPEDLDVQNSDIEPDSKEIEMYDKYLKSYDKDNSNYLMDLFNNKYQRWEPSYSSPYNLYDYLTAGRYRRSQTGRFRKSYPRARLLKRGKRIKRDLYFTSDILGKNYNPYEERYLETPYGNQVEELDDDDIRYLLALLENAEAEGYGDESAGYDEELYPTYPGYFEPELDSDDSEYYIPKRQAGLTFVPGLKRSGDFFPSFEEPGSHFSAFVPQKRNMEYAQAYQKLMQLAAELNPQAYYPSEYDFEDYYRKK